MDARGDTPATNVVKSILLEAWSDQVAGVHAFSSCITTLDIFADGNYRLIIADDDRRLKVWLPKLVSAVSCC